MKPSIFIPLLVAGRAEIAVDALIGGVVRFGNLTIGFPLLHAIKISGHPGRLCGCRVKTKSGVMIYLVQASHHPYVVCQNGSDTRARHLLICSIPTPGCIGTTHPVPIKENVTIFTIKKGIGQFGLLPTSSGVFLAVGALYQIAQKSLAIVEIYAGTMFLVDFSFTFGRFASLRAA